MNKPIASRCAARMIEHDASPLHVLDYPKTHGWEHKDGKDNSLTKSWPSRGAFYQGY
jgi:hypothetical protein